MTTIEETVSLASSVSRDGEVLIRRLGELITAQRRLVAGWEKLARARPEPILETPPWADAEVRVLQDAGQIADITRKLCASAVRHLRIIGDEQPPAVTRPRAGVRCQVIRSTAARGAGSVAREVRFRDHLPLELVHADDSIAIVTTGDDARTAVLVNSSAMVAITADWFDQLWNRSRARPDAAQITEQQRRVLALMPTADDRVIARKLDVSVTTVRRQIKAIYDALGVNSRFAAGVSAAKRGWI